MSFCFSSSCLAFARGDCQDCGVSAQEGTAQFSPCRQRSWQGERPQHRQLQPAFPLALLAVSAVVLSPAFLRGEDLPRRRFVEIRRFAAAEANQGVAVDGQSFFAIASRSIGRYDKKTGRKLAVWKASRKYPLKHLNHGIVWQGKLYCAHSNSPDVPTTSSVEIFDATTLRHVGTHSFGISEGALTWIDRHQKSWWAVFAHYTYKELKGSGHDTRWTTLVQFDDNWQRRQAWIFPEAVLKKFHPFSCSGGGWGPDGLLYVSGHDAAEVYVLRLPQAGSTLQLVETVPVSITGQAFAWDKSEPGLFYGINRPRSQVVVSRFSLRKIPRQKIPK